jgi:hypothetical protein
MGTMADTDALQAFDYGYLLQGITADGITCGPEAFREANRVLLSGDPQVAIEDPEVGTIVTYARQTCELLDLLEDQWMPRAMQVANHADAGPDAPCPSIRLGQLMQRLDATGDARLRAIVQRVRRLYGATGRPATEETLARGTGEFHLSMLESARPDPATVSTMNDALSLLRRFDRAIGQAFGMPVNLGRVVATLAPQGKVRHTPSEIVATGLKIADAMRAFRAKSDDVFTILRNTPFFRERETPSLDALLRQGGIISYPVTGRQHSPGLPSNVELDAHASEILASAACLNILKSPYLPAGDTLAIRRGFAHHGFKVAQPDPVRLLIALEQAELQLDDIADSIFAPGRRVFLATSATFNITRFKSQPCFVIIENGRYRLGMLTREDAAHLRDGGVQIYSPLSVRLT